MIRLKRFSFHHFWIVFFLWFGYCGWEGARSLSSRKTKMLEGEFGSKWVKPLLSWWVRERTSGELLLSVAAVPAQLGFYVASYVFPSYAISLMLASSMNK